MRLWRALLLGVWGATGAGLQAQPLIQAEDLRYVGAFRVPEGGDSENTFEYGGTALGFRPDGPSLYVTGHAWHQRMAEISVPEPVAGSELDALPRATLLRAFVDVAAQLAQGEGDRAGGAAVYQNRLIFTRYIYYDAAGEGRLSHGTAALDLTDVRGLFEPEGIGAAFVNGFMCHIPAMYQGAFGGPMLTGNAALSIISRTSYGPAASVFDPGTLGSSNRFPVAPVLAYPQAHPLGEYGTTNPYYNGSTAITGIAFPDGTASVLFFGRHGLGPDCYGVGTDDPALHGQQVPGEPAGVTYCFDPCNSSKGGHGYPYKFQIWVYDAADLLQVLEGTSEPWDPRPYAVWNPEVPFATNCVQIGGAAYDPSLGRLYVSQLAADGPSPVILVYSVTNAAGATGGSGSSSGQTTTGTGGTGGGGTGNGSGTGGGSGGGSGGGGSALAELPWTLKLMRPKEGRPVRAGSGRGLRAVWRVEGIEGLGGSTQVVARVALVATGAPGWAWEAPDRVGKVNRKGRAKVVRRGLGRELVGGTVFELLAQASTNFGVATSAIHRVTFAVR